jgi:hypothetical protein
MFFFWTGLGEQMPARGRVLLLLKIRVAKIQDLKEKKGKNFRFSVARHLLVENGG